jgi:hypothetical protein
MSRVSRKRSASDPATRVAPIEPTLPAATAGLPAPFFHADSDAIRFWVDVDGHCVGATVSRQTLHYRFRPEGREEDPMTTFRHNASVMETAVRRRVRQGSIEPVMLRENDLMVRASP